MIIRGNLTWYGGNGCLPLAQLLPARGRRGSRGISKVESPLVAGSTNKKISFRFRTLIKSKLGNLFHTFSRPLLNTPIEIITHSFLALLTILLEPHTHWLQSSTESCFHSTLHVPICLSEMNNSTVTKLGLGTLTSHIPAPFKNWISFHTNPKDTGNPHVSCYHLTFVWQFPTYHLHLNLYR